MGTLTEAHVFRVTVISKGLGLYPILLETMTDTFQCSQNHTKILSNHSTHLTGKKTFNLDKGRKPNKGKKLFI